jgi:hypothetical protein
MHDREHVISVVLSDEEWKAFLRVHPQPVIWLRERIQETIATTPEVKQDHGVARVAATV